MNFINMNTEKNKRWSWVLILLSLIVLSLFIGYWNYQAYSKVKNQLATDIRYELGAAYNEVKDAYVKDIFSFVSKTTSKDSNNITIVSKKQFVPKIEITSFEEEGSDFSKTSAQDTIKSLSIFMIDDSPNQKSTTTNSSEFRLVQNEKGGLIWAKRDSIDEKDPFTSSSKKILKKTCSMIYSLLPLIKTKKPMHYFIKS